MLNITKTIEYSLIAIRHINDKGTNKLCTSKEISEFYNIPKELLAKTMQKLCKKGYLKTKKGPHGGYYINTNLNDISLINLIEDIEGPVALIECVSNLNCTINDTCNIKSPLKKINNNIRKVLSDITLYDLTT
tara:strand:+ start:278 stop:676 length:399 start_codon:yes stop_codon:yes gene_type:complete